MVAFIIWSITALIIIYIGIRSRNLDHAAGFFSNVEPPKVKDIKAYNDEVGKLFIGCGIVLEFIGLPLLTIEQNNPLVVFVVLGVVFLSLTTIVIYTFIENKYRV